MIKDVEDFRAELNVECFRNPCNREVLGCGDVHVYKFWPDDRIAAGITQ